MRVLIVKTSSMGDVIHTFPALEDALAARPDIEFGWCVEEGFAGIVALHPKIRSIHRVALRRWRKHLFSAATWREAAALRQELHGARYDLVLDAQGLLKSAVVAGLAGAPVWGLDRASAREPIAARFYARSFAVPRGLHAIERTRRLFGQALGYAPDLSRLASGVEPPPAGYAAAPGARTAFLLHGASRDDKKWSIVEWQATARALLARGLTPLVTWSSDTERQVAESIAAVPGVVVIPRSPLPEIAGAIGRSDLAIGVDTGLTHLAAAFGLPTVAVFLSTEPGLTGPRGAYASSLSAGPGRPVRADDVVLEAEKLIAQRRAL
ncbi:MAG: lipopolysaccharide heptosyltransferase I [Mesorhizobium sp.]|nr:lipopolysaccharide heptosyltransferase I [Mesorhizobium sp.]MCO5162763.1 lipopolysaccharide heptosyltransferase I [Mesorhizobium sp.]